VSIPLLENEIREDRREEGHAGNGEQRRGEIRSRPRRNRQHRHEQQYRCPTRAARFMNGCIPVERCAVEAEAADSSEGIDQLVKVPSMRKLASISTDCQSSGTITTHWQPPGPAILEPPGSHNI
jgi:hypothetical protein